ncbi:unnamed protein product, partial [marine sediment metagenome]
MKGTATGEVHKRGRRPGGALPHRLVAESGKGVDQVFSVGMEWLFEDDLRSRFLDYLP